MRLQHRTPTSGRALHRLTQERVTQLLHAQTPGRHADGGNLYLRIRLNRVPTWVFLYQAAGGGPPREMRLGHGQSMPLSRARDLAARARNERAAGTDPLALRAQARESARKARSAAKQQAARELNTLGYVAERLHDLLAPTFRNGKHATQWITSLETHVPAATWGRPIEQVTPGELLEFLQPLYVRLPETARRVRMRLDNVFDDAMMRGLCPGNPAAAIKKTLSKFGGKKKKGSFTALPWTRVPQFAARLRSLEGISARALEFALLTVARTSEVLGMTWPEVDLVAQTWMVPGERMKGGEQHVVSLSTRAVEILKGARGLDIRVVFPSMMREGQPLSNMAMLMTLRRLESAKETTVHGLCRASFSTWANERGYRPDVIEACLAHRERDLVRRAYNRATFADERKQLLADWCAFIIDQKQSTVTSLKEARTARAKRAS